MSLRLRLLIALLVLAAGGGWLLVSLLVDDLRPRYLESMEETMVDTAEVRAGVAAQHDEAGRVVALRAAFARAVERRLDARIYGLTKTRVELRAYLTDAQGRVLFDARTPSAEGEDLSHWHDVKRTLDGIYGARTTRSDPADARSAVLHVAAPVIVDGRTVGVLTVMKPAHSVTAFMDIARRQIVRLVAALAVTVLLLGAAISLWVTRPLSRLTAWAEALRVGSRVPPPPQRGPREIRALAAAFASLVESIEGRRSAQRQLQALAHEMKSPLSSIRGAAELLAEEIDGRAMPAEQRVRFLRNLLTEGARVQGLVDMQLQLAALESRTGLHDPEPLDLATVGGEVLDSMQPQVATKHLRLTSDLAAGAVVVGERFLIRLAVVNLVQNAIDFSPMDGGLRVSVSVSAGQVAVVVEDDGPGIPDFALDKVFDRFFSLQRPDTGRRSSGLGLTLVREVAALHGGTVGLSNLATGGASARLVLPVGAAPATGPQMPGKS